MTRHNQRPQRETSVSFLQSFHFSWKTTDNFAGAREQTARNYAATYFSGIGPATRSRLESISRDAPTELPAQSMQLRSAPPQGLFARPGQPQAQPRVKSS